MKKHNFYAGPSILSEYTIKNTAAAVENFAGMGLSLLEISHRSKEFVAVNDEARALIKELLDVPAGYEVVFMGGGASMQFCMVPYNLLNKKASYLDTGTWASNAIKEAKLFGEVEEMLSELLSMISLTKEAFEKESSEIASRIFLKDNLIDEINHNSTAIIAKYIEEHKGSALAGLYMAGVIRKMERFGDHCTNIAEELIFYLDAKVMKHMGKTEQ